MLRRTFVGPLGSSCLIASLLLSSAGIARAGDDSAPANESAAPAAAPSEAAIREASDHYEAGLALYADGEFKRAAIEFDRAYELVPNYRALYNIGQVRIQLHDYARAYKALKAYLAQGGDKIDAERRKSVSDDLEMLTTRTATLAIECNEPGADILVDGDPAGTTPLAEPLLLDTGDHRITVRKDGFDAREQLITLASRDTQNLRIEIQKTPPTRPPVVVVAPEQQQTDRTAWIWGTWSATAAFAAGAAVTGGLGIHAANDLDHLRSTLGTTRDQLDSAQSRAQTLLRAADIMGGLAIATGGVALYLTLSKPSSKDKEKPAAPQAAVSVTPSRVMFSTTF